MFHSAGLSAFLALGLLAKRVATTPAPTARSDASVVWGSCESFGVNSTGPTNLECAHFEVPMDYHDSSAGNASLALIKLAATGKKQGTLFFNPGGPGISGIQALSTLSQVFDQYFQGSFDVVSWDPRGVGNNTFPGEVYCFNSTEEDVGFWDYTPVANINETISGKFNERDLNELYSTNATTEQKFKDFAARCQSGPSGPYLKYLGTSSTIRDLVALGDAIVGEGEPIDYWGISYGTVIGFNFINMFPKRAGRVILDGVIDATKWVSLGLPSNLLVDTEKTFFGLTDGCAKAGKAGCKLIEITGDNASGDDVKDLLNYAHDVTLKLYRGGYPVPALPGTLTDLLFDVLLSPSMWSQSVNGYIYQFVALILQIAQANNVTVPGGGTYNVPSVNITDPTGPVDPGTTPVSNLTSYTTAAVIGADDFGNGKTTINDVFDMIVQVTRNVTPTFGTIWGLGYAAYKWPVRSVQKLPPYCHPKLNSTVLIIGNSADPITPLAGAKKAAATLGNHAFLIEQAGFGHTSFAQFSSCTVGVIFNYLTNNTLPRGRSIKCPVDDTDLFPVLNETTTVSRRSNILRRWW